MQLPPARYLIVVLLGLLPTAVYWNTVFHSFGFRDDYSILREAREEPGKVFAFCSSHGRPVYGALLEQSFALLRSVDDLRWIRLLTALLLGVVSVATFGCLRRVGWDPCLAALVAILVSLLPGAQVMVSWAVTWPFVLALLLAAGAFACNERAFRQENTTPEILPWLGAVLLIAISALIYQASPFYMVVLIAAGFLGGREAGLRRATERVIRHLVTLGLGVGVAFTLVFVGFAMEWIPTSDRIAIEGDWKTKFISFLADPLHNALALIILNRTDEATVVPTLAAQMVGLVLMVGVGIEWLRRGAWFGVMRLATLGFFLIASHSALLAVGQEASPYRTLLPLTGVVAVYFAASLRDCLGSRAARVTLVVLVAVGAVLARQQAFRLIAWPQGLEWELIQDGAGKIDFADRPSVFIRWPREDDRPGWMRFGDEFGSFSSLSSWTPLEMLKVALWERFPGESGLERFYSADTGKVMDASEDYALVIDMRQLRQFRENGRGD